jgi:hypothetical protein
MTTETLPERAGGSGLALTSDQTWWNNRQRAALDQLGVQGASDGDLMVFMHVAQRTGLDPFARQIYMIGRNGREQDANGQWVNVVKQTIQTGIDGFRLVARRAADRLGETLEYEDTQWCGATASGPTSGPTAPHPPRPRSPSCATAAGSPPSRSTASTSRPRPTATRTPCGRRCRPTSWRSAPRPSRCARPTRRTCRGSTPTTRWGRPTGPSRAASRRQASGIAAALHPTRGAPGGAGGPHPQTDATEAGEDVVDGRVVEDPPAEETPRLDMRSQLAKKLFAVMHEAGITEERQHEFLSNSLGRTITSRKDLTDADAAP